MPDSADRRRVTLELPPVALVALRAVTAALAVAALHFGQDILVPLALAGLLAFLLDPLVGRLVRWRVPRAGAVGLVTLFTVAMLGATTWIVGGQVLTIGRDLPRYQSTIEKKLRTLRQQLEGQRSLSSATRLLDAVENEVDKARKALHADAPASAKQPEPLRVKVAAAEVSRLQALQDLVMPIANPLLSAGVVIVLLVFVLLERHDIRDRAMRLTGGELHDMTDALNEAARRIGRYLRSQLLVNAAYGLPLAAGLWAIGVPGAWLWGLLGALLRFVPYLGPVIASVFPLALAFVVDPGWQMLLWTLALVLVLELIINNVVEPWLYGSSTGLAPVAVLLSAAFWTVLWGPVGLVLATPLTVVCVVLGRHLPSLRFLDVLLGSRPVFDGPTRLYQRLLTGHVESALEIAETEIAERGLPAFYDQTALPALALAAADAGRASGAHHRHRVRAGMAAVLRELQDLQELEDRLQGSDVRCIGLRWESDTLAATMAAQALATQGLSVQAQAATTLSAERIGQLDLGDTRVVLLSSFHPDPEPLVRYACRRLLRLRPDLQIVLGLWDAPAAMRAPGAAATWGARAVATSLAEAVERARALAVGDEALVDGPHDVVRVAARRARCASLSPERANASLQAAQRAVEVFGVDHAQVRWADDGLHAWQADPTAPKPVTSAVVAGLLQPMWGDGEPRVSADLSHDARIAEPPTADDPAAVPHFAAAVPLRTADGELLGSMLLLGLEPHTFGSRELALLGSMADELVQRVCTTDDATEAEPAPTATPGDPPPAPDTPAAAAAPPTAAPPPVRLRPAGGWT